MKNIFKALIIGAIATTAILGAASTASAQNCNGPLGEAPCRDVQRWMWERGLQFHPNQIVPRDAQIVAQHYHMCGGEPRCMAAKWAAVEMQRCSGGVGVPGGCFGPGGEIMKGINRVLPEHLHPNNVLKNIHNDLTNGPGKGNEVCKLFKC